MEFAYTSLFGRSFADLTKKQQGRITDALEKFMAQPHYPFPKGLRVHKLGGVTGTATKVGEPRPPVWEMHATGELLITFQYGSDEVLFRNCGHHRDVLNSP